MKEVVRCVQQAHLQETPTDLNVVHFITMKLAYSIVQSPS